MPQGREARLSLITTWLVLTYLVMQVVGSMSWQVALSFDGVRHAVGVVAAVGLTAMFVRLQDKVLRRDLTPRARVAAGGLIASGALLLPLSDAWATVGLSLATLMLCFRPRVVVVVGVVITAGVVLLLWSQASDPVALVGIPMIVWLAATIIVVLTKMVIVLEDLRLAREHIARLRIDEERDRISRELHDILGRTLVAASLRTQTALRLVDRDPQGCQNQLEQIGETLTDGQAQLRRLVSGQTLIGLDTEIATARDLLSQLGIEFRLDSQMTGLSAADEDREPASEAELLAAAVLRESVTNMLKHSRPRVVTLHVSDREDSFDLRIVNDGTLKDHGARRDSANGTGIRELAARAAEAGGRLQARQDSGRRFVVEASIPITAPTGRSADGAVLARANTGNSHEHRGSPGGVNGQ